MRNAFSIPLNAIKFDGLCWEKGIVMSLRYYQIRYDPENEDPLRKRRAFLLFCRKRSYYNNASQPEFMDQLVSFNFTEGALVVSTIFLSGITTVHLEINIKEDWRSIY